MTKITQLILRGLCVLFFIGTSTLMAQQTIAWSVETLTTGAGEVQTAGTLVQALNFGGGATASDYDATVNTVPFTGVSNGADMDNAFANPTLANFSSNTNNVVPSQVDNYDPGAGGIADYDAILSRFLWNGGNPGTVTLSGLTANNTYRVQFFMGDTRGGSDGNYIIIGVSGGTSFGSNSGAESTVYGGNNPGIVINGEFTAVGTSVSIDIAKDSNDFNLNAYQLRDVSSLSLEDKSFGSFKMFPNPARDVLKLSLDQVFDSSLISIKSLTGQLILSKSITKKNTEIDISSLKSGLYLVQVESDNASITKKLIVE